MTDLSQNWTSSNWIRFHNENQNILTKPMSTNTPSFTSVRLPFNHLDVILFATFIISFLVFGLFANLLTMFVIASSKKLRSIFHFFIFSLCISDTISALISWINLYRRTWGFNGFVLPNVVCVIYWGVDIWTSYSTALHILSFAILRFICLKWPHKMTTLKKNHLSGIIWIVTLWALAFFCGALPMGMFSGAEAKDRSASTPDSKWPECTQLNAWLSQYGLYTFFAYPIFFYVPIFCTVAISISIAFIMIRKGNEASSHMTSSTAQARRRKEKQAILQLMFIVISFLIGYLPFTAFEFQTFQQKNDTYENWWFDWHFGTIQYVFLRFSECLNPILYNLGSRKIWKETKEFLVRNHFCSASILDSESRSLSIL